jgi:carbonic anhydrase/acetyltransferase-like protein (isoleucine patch superfamily)
MYLKAKNKNYEFVSYISSSAKTYETNSIGNNVVILAGVILEPFAVIGSNVFLNTGVIVCHHAKIYDHCFLAARSMVGGFTEVLENSFIGFSATILQKLVLARETLLGAGAVLAQNTCEHSKYIGVPAIQSGTHEATGICILD